MVIIRTRSGVGNVRGRAIDTETYVSSGRDLDRRSIQQYVWHASRPATIFIPTTYVWVGYVHDSNTDAVVAVNCCHSP